MPMSKAKDRPLDTSEQSLSMNTAFALQHSSLEKMSSHLGIPTTPETATMRPSPCTRTGSSRSIMSSVYKGAQYYYKKASDMGLYQREPLFLGLWASWVLTGSLYYGYATDYQLGFIKGFYMAINIGYSIGFGYPIDINTDSIWFSTFYVLIGSSFVGVALGFFAEKITSDSEAWFSRLQQEKELEDLILLGNRNWKGRLHAWLFARRFAIRAVTLWLVFVICIIVVTLAGVGWTFREAQYAAISTLSTGGHWMIPEESPVWLYGIMGILTMFGVPVMAMAMAAVGETIMDQGSLEAAKGAIDSPVTREELQLLEDLGLEDGDGRIELAEYLLLCMVRVGTDPGLLAYIRQRFKELSGKNEDFLTIEEVTQQACTFQNGLITSFSQRGNFKVEELAMDSEEDEEEEIIFYDANQYDANTKVRVESLGTGKHHNPHTTHDNSDISLPSAMPCSETDISDMEEGQYNSHPIVHFDFATKEKEEKDDGTSNPFPESTVLQPDVAPRSARALRRDDDYGMALLNRTYEMTQSEEKHLLKEARHRMNGFIKASLEEEGWSIKKKVADVKILSKESSSNILQVKGVVELGEEFSEDFLSSQVKYDKRSEDTVCQYYRRLDPLCIQTTIPSRIQSDSNLLDKEGREDCAVFWTAWKSSDIFGLVRERDGCLVGHSRRFKCPVTGDPVFVSHFFSIEHPSVPDMERALGRVRAEVKMAGYVVRPSKVNKEGCQMTYLMHYDAKGFIPAPTMNAFSISQGLNAARYRDVFKIKLEKAMELNNAMTPLGCYDLKSGASVIHELHLAAAEEECIEDASSGRRSLMLARKKADAARTFKFQVCVHADKPVTMKLATTDADGIPLPFINVRSIGAGKIGERLATGRPVSFGGKGNQKLNTSLLLSVRGAIPGAFILAFENGSWRHNKIYVPAITMLTTASTLDLSNTFNERRKSWIFASKQRHKRNLTASLSLPQNPTPTPTRSKSETFSLPQKPTPTPTRSKSETF